MFGKDVRVPFNPLTVELTVCSSIVPASQIRLFNKAVRALCREYFGASGQLTDTSSRFTGIADERTLEVEYFKWESSDPNIEESV